MTSVLLPEGELRVARCDTLDKLIAVGDGDAALLYLYILRHGSEDGRLPRRKIPKRAKMPRRSTQRPSFAAHETRTASFLLYAMPRRMPSAARSPRACCAAC